MTRLHSVNSLDAIGELGTIFSNIRKAVGMVPNAYAVIGTHSVQILQSMLAREGVIGSGSLTNAEVEVIKLVVSELAGCDYCVAAHTLIGKLAGLTQEQTKSVRNGNTTGNHKLDELVHFVRELQQSRGTIETSKVQAVLDAGYSEAQLIEIAFVISSITFTNVVNRINNTIIDFPQVD